MQNSSSCAPSTHECTRYNILKMPKFPKNPSPNVEPTFLEEINVREQSVSCLPSTIDREDQSKHTGMAPHRSKGHAKVAYNYYF